jgi:CSLREA domain-containing protein
MAVTMGRLRRNAAAAALLATATLTVAAAGASAAPVTVTTTADASSGPSDAGLCASGGSCSLRQALVAARGADSTITLPAGTYVLTKGELSVQQGSGTVRIAGAGAAASTIDQDTAGSRVLAVQAGGAVVLSGLTVTGGTLRGGDGADGKNGVIAFPGPSQPPEPGAPGAAARGGGILNAGVLTLSDVVVRDNGAAGGDGGDGGDGAPLADSGAAGGAGGLAEGAGIANDGTLRLQLSRVAHNTLLG